MAGEPSGSIFHPRETPPEPSGSISDPEEILWMLSVSHLALCQTGFQQRFRLHFPDSVSYRIAALYFTMPELSERFSSWQRSRISV